MCMMTFYARMTPSSYCHPELRGSWERSDLLRLSEGSRIIHDEILRQAQDDMAVAQDDMAVAQDDMAVAQDDM